MRRGPAIFLLFALLFGAAYSAWWGAREGWVRLTQFAPPHFAAERPTSGSTALAGRLVLIVVDGLRPEEADLLPSLEWLQRRGASYRLTVPGPSYHPAVVATLLTGAPPTIHGIVLPGAAGPVAADHLLDAARRARIQTGGAGSPELGSLLSGAVDTWHQGSSASELMGGIEALLQPGGPRLVVIQIPDLAAAIRATGTAEIGQADYRDGLARLDAALVKILDLIDWNATAVIVTGSTPLDARGERREGGQIPLLLAGAGIRPGARGDASLLDLAPTAAALLGLPTPLQAQGRPLLPALAVEGRPADALVQSYLGARRSYVAAVLKALGSAQAPPELPGTAVEAEAYLAGLTLQVQEARWARAQARIAEMLPYLGGGGLVLLIYLAIVYSRPFGRVVLLGHLLYGLAFHGLFYILGGRYGPNLAGLESPPRHLLLRYGLASGGAMLAAAATAGALLARRGFRRSSYMTTAVQHMLLSLVTLVALPVAAAVLLVGWEFPDELPAIGLWVWFFLSALQVMVLGGLSPVWAWVAVRTARFVRRHWPPKETGDPEIAADKRVRLRAIRRAGGSGARV